MPDAFAVLALSHPREPASAGRQSADQHCAVHRLARRHELGPLGEFLALNAPLSNSALPFSHSLAAQPPSNHQHEVSSASGRQS
jgi:hypothetical protein